MRARIVAVVCGFLVWGCQKDTKESAATDDVEVVARAERPQDVIAHAVAEASVMRALSNAVGMSFRQSVQTRQQGRLLPPEDLQKGATILSVVFSGNTHGEVDDCGCKANPLGGIARRATLIEAVSTPSDWWNHHDWTPNAVISVDAGDLLFKSSTLDRAPAQEQTRARYEAETLVAALNELQPSAVLAGELDFALGLDTFEALVAASKFKWISANLKRGDALLLAPTARFEAAGREIGVIGLTRPEPSRTDYWKERGLSAEDPATAYKAHVGSIADANLVVLLSNLGARDTERLIESLSPAERPDVVYLSNSNALTRDPIWVGGTPMFEPLSQGKMVGRTDLLLRGPERPEWVNQGVDLQKVGQAYRRAWSNYTAARQRISDVRRDAAEQALEATRVPQTDKPTRDRIDKQRSFLAKELQRANERLGIVSADLVRAASALDAARAAEGQPSAGDDWVDVQMADVKLAIPGERRVQKVVDARAKKRPVTPK